MSRAGRILNSISWKHAIGEIILIVVGVSIALAAEGWRQDRANRVIELEYIEGLIRDLGRDIVSVSNIMDQTQLRAEYGETVIAAYDDEFRPSSPTNLIKAVEYANYFSYPSYSRATIEDLMSTGNLRLIRNKEVKEVISVYYATIEWTQQFSGLFRDTQQILSNLIPEFLDLEHRYLLFEEGVKVGCGPTLSCVVLGEGIPWNSSTSQITEADANRVLERLRSKPEARALYANMAHIHGVHYSNLAGIRRLAEEANAVLRDYVQDRQ
jgi:hypothetical protein